MDIKRTRDQLFQIFSSSDFNFYMKVLQKSLIGSYVAILYLNWSKIDPKRAKNKLKAHRASQDLFSTSHEKQNIVFQVKVHALGIEALICPLSNPSLT